MPSSIPALVNPSVLLWARQQCGYDLEEAARRMPVKPERLLAWEEGKRPPTIRQAQGLARIYRRPLGVFFLPQPPVLPPLAAEYRRLPGVHPGAESPELRFALREMSVRRQATIELREELGYPIEEFGLRARLTEGAESVGAKLRALLGITIAEQFGWKDGWQAWRRWRSAAEEAAVLVFQFAGVPLRQTRGVSLLRFPLPVVGINTKESVPESRVFTLLHEIAHIALAAAREESPAASEKRDDGSWSLVERFAEEVAAATFLPEEPLRAVLVSRDGRPSEWGIDDVRDLARRFRATPLAMATRLRSMGEMSWPEYRKWKIQWDNLVSQLPPKGGGFASPVDKALGRGGRPFARLVLEALDSNRITAAQASHYLDLKFGHFESLRLEIRAGGQGTGIAAGEE